MRGSKVRKRRTRKSLATELRHRTIVSRALRSGEFKLKSGINVAPTGYPIYSVLSLRDVSTGSAGMFFQRLKHHELLAAIR